MSKKSVPVISASHLSPGVRAMNKALFGPHPTSGAFAAAVKAGVVIKKGKKRREMNRTEHEFSLILEIQRTCHEIVSWEYEGITLRWEDGMVYTPDFFVIESVDADLKPPHVRIRLIEIKGAHAWQKDIVKFRAARSRWNLFEFQFWQKGPQGWEQTR